MASIGIEFELRASVEAFRRGMARASNSVHDLKKQIREGDLGNGIKQMLGAGAIIAAFRSVVNHAQETRKAFEEMGKPIPENIRSIAQFGDAIDGLKKGAMELGVYVVGGLTQAGESAGNMIVGITNKFRAMKGKAALETDEKGDRAVAEREAELAATKARIRARNTHENLIKLNAELAAVQKKTNETGLGDIEKRNQLLGEQAALIDKVRGLLAQQKAGGPVDEASILDARTDLAKKTGEIVSSQFGMRGRHDKYLGTMEQLANADVTEGMDPAKRKAIMDARKAFQLEAQADQQGFAGKFDLSDATKSQAGRLRAGLGGFVKSDEVDKGRQEIDSSIEKLNDTLNNKALVVSKVY